MHPEQRWMIKYLIASTALAIVGATVAVTDPPLEKLGALAARAVTPSWTAVSRLAPTIQTAEAQFAADAVSQATDALTGTTEPDAAEPAAPILAQSPAQAAPFPPTPAVATPVPALPIFSVPARAIALPVMARTIGYVEMRDYAGKRCTVIRTTPSGAVRQSSGPVCSEAR